MGSAIRTADATAARWATIATVSTPAASSGPSARAGRQRLSADQRRGQVFAATADAIAATGYANVTLTEVARRAGIAKGLVWHYFSDRDDLMQQTLAHLGNVIRDAVVDDLDVSAPAPDVVREVIRRTALLTRTHRAELDAMAQIVQSLRTPDGQQRITVRAYDATYGEHQRLLARGQAEGTIRPADPRVMAVIYQGAIDAMIGYLQDHPEVDPEAEAQAVADVLLSGFTTR